MTLDGLLNDNPINKIICDGNNIYLGTSYEGLIIYDIPTKKYKIFRHDINNPNSIGHDYIRTILIDKKGNIWAGTYRSGISLLKKESTDFISINKTSGLTSDYIRCIEQLPDGTILVGTYNGLDAIDPETERISRYDYRIGQGNLSHYSIHMYIYGQGANTLDRHICRRCEL